MKLSILLLASLMSTTLMAKTTVKIPMSVSGKNKIFTAAEINKKYKLQGEKKILEFMIVDTTSESLRAAHDLYWDEYSKVEDLGLDLNLDLIDPVGCYTGNPTEAVNIIGSLADGPFSDQMGIWGWKYKKSVNLESDSEEFLNQESKIWKNWKGNDESILILTHITDGGEDVIESVITKCN